MQFMDDPFNTILPLIVAKSMLWMGAKNYVFFGSYRIIITAVHNIANIFMLSHASVIS